eukprot:2745260-Alexandrium_andersonii.AAC.1
MVRRCRVHVGDVRAGPQSGGAAGFSASPVARFPAGHPSMGWAHRRSKEAEGQPKLLKCTGTA